MAINSFLKSMQHRDRINNPWGLRSNLKPKRETSGRRRPTDTCFSFVLNFSRVAWILEPQESLEPCASFQLTGLLWSYLTFSMNFIQAPSFLQASFLFQFIISILLVHVCSVIVTSCWTVWDISCIYVQCASYLYRTEEAIKTIGV